MKNQFLETLSKEKLIELLEIYSKNWLADDGAWFQTIEKRHGMDEAMICDIEAWKIFTVAEARRIKKFLNLEKNAGLEGLAQALRLRFYANINQDEIIFEKENGKKILIYKNVDCFVQTARAKKNLPYHPCKPVGLEEYSGFARVIDERIVCECVSCFPEITDETCCCFWKFYLK